MPKSIYDLMSTEELKEKERELTSLIQAAQDTLDKVENELFYRKHPECRIVSSGFKWRLTAP